MIRPARGKSRLATERTPMHAARGWTLLVFVVLVVVSLLAAQPARAPLASPLATPRRSSWQRRTVFRRASCAPSSPGRPLRRAGPAARSGRTLTGRTTAPKAGTSSCSESSSARTTPSRAAAKPCSGAVMLSSALVGVPLSATRTSVKPLPNPASWRGEAYAFQAGRIWLRLTSISAAPSLWPRFPSLASRRRGWKSPSLPTLLAPESALEPRHAPSDPSCPSSHRWLPAILDVDFRPARCEGRGRLPGDRHVVAGRGRPPQEAARGPALRIVGKVLPSGGRSAGLALTASALALISSG